MKNSISRFTLAIIISSLFITVSNSFDRVVLFELFTSSTCGPCGSIVPLIDAFLGEHSRDELVQIAYHMNWPGAGNDPFYLNNPTDNDNRRSYYGINSVPALKCDGILGNSAGAYASYYAQRENVYAPVEIDLDLSMSTTIEMAAYVTADDALSAQGLKLRVALVAISYDIPPGNWTYTHFEYGMLDMSPNGNGISFDIEPDQTVELSTSFPIPAITGPENLAIIAFVQHDVSQTVLNAKYAAIPLDYPNLLVSDSEIVDNIGGDPNGIPEGGETCELVVELQNLPPFATASNIYAELSTDDPDITITDNTADFPDIDPDASGDNSDNPFVFELDPALEAHNVTLQLDIFADGYSTTQFISFIAGLPAFLVVDDDGGERYETAFLEDLDTGNEVYNYWNVYQDGAPTAEYLLNYELVIWHTGMETDPLDQDEQDAIAAYLDAIGTKLFMSSENLGDALGDSSFYQDYFHAAHEIDHILTTSMSGVEGHPISDGTSLLLVGGEYWPDSQSTIIPDGEADAVYNYTNLAASTGVISYAGSYALLYFAVPYECIAPNPTSSTPRAEVMSNIISWFNEFEVSVDPDMELAAVNYLLCEVYPNPFNPSATISFSLPQSGMVTAAVFNVNGARVAEVYSGQMKAGQHTFEFDGSELSSGIYFLNIESPSGLTVQKMVLMK